jgi:eukaryotic-like serine/threonine-protein kinase
MAAAERHLLFGLIALQVGLIDQANLVAAFQAWARDKRQSLADHLAAQGALDAADRLAVEAMVARHLTKRANDVEKSLASIPVGRSTREGLASIGEPAIEASLTHIGSGARRDDHEADRTASYAVGTAMGDGLRFRILRPHAQGGLGAVFVALDGELNREVALKQILEKHADDPVSRGRFLLEAEITGGLEHPGVVPVYGLGTYSDGRPYYAMRLIEGETLKEAIDRFHAGKSKTGGTGPRLLELRKLLRRFTDVCNAMEYAHSRGVLHRDIKPRNIIVGRHGETLVVDWGLAKATGKSDPSTAERTLLPSSASGSSETLPGSALGTPAYMSPEQAEGRLERLGPRSDVYSLGATLYCLLTGQPPFAGDVADVIRAVQRGEFTRPRQLDSSIDPALETICLTAMAQRSEDRYSSCRALADDLDRWMADEPVSAWREPFSRRARRWSRRNRTAVTALGVAVVAGVAGLVALAGVQAQANSSLRAANTQVKRANTELAAEKARVQERYDLAMEAIETFHTGVSEDFLLKEAKFKDLRDRLLKAASDFYGKLGALLKNRSDRASRKAMLQANFELAELTDKVGKPDDALAAHRQVLAAREALAAETQADPAITAEVGRSLTAVAFLLDTTGRTGESEAMYRKAEALLLTLAPKIAEGAAARAVLAKCRSNLGWLLHNTGRNDEALSVFRLARADQEALAAGAGATAESRRQLADTINRVAILLKTTGNSSEAEADYRKALTIFQKLADDNPAVTDFRGSLARSHNNLGVLLSEMGKSAEAVAEFRTALAQDQKLADDNPAVTEFRNSLARSHSNLGTLLSPMGSSSEAAAELRAALSLQQKLADDNPAVTDFRKSLARSRNNLANLLSDMGKSSEAAAEHREALAIREKLAQDNPAVTEFCSDLAQSHYNLGLLLWRTGKRSEAEAESQKALTIRQKLADDHPAVTEFRDQLAASHFYRAWVFKQTGKAKEAEAEFRTALAIRQKLADDDPAVSEFRRQLALTHKNLGILLADTGNLAEAESEQEKALSIRQKLADDNPATSQFQRDLAGGLDDIGCKLAQAGRMGDAIGYYKREAAIWQKLAEGSSASVADRSSLAKCEATTADAFRRSGRLDDALAACERALAVRELLVKAHPEVPDYRAALCDTYLRLGQVRRDLESLAGAADAWRRASEQYESNQSPDGANTFHLACCHAGLAGLAGRRGSGVSNDEGEVRAEKAMGLLRQAVTMGFRNPDAYRTESALDPLRNRPDFRALIMDLAMPSEPFAR